MPNLIGFTGVKGAGKDTAALLLIERGYKNFKFATPLKEMARAYFRSLGASEEEIFEFVDGSRKEEPTDYLLGKTSREFQQFIGTELGRDFIGSDVWTNALKKAVEAYNGASVVTDVRFFNEVELIQSMGGIVIRVVNDRVVGNEFSLHPSEVDIPYLPVDFELENNLTITEMHQSLSWAIHNFEKDEAVDNNR